MPTIGNNADLRSLTDNFNPELSTGKTSPQVAKHHVTPMNVDHLPVETLEEASNQKSQDPEAIRSITLKDISDTGEAVEITIKLSDSEKEAILDKNALSSLLRQGVDSRQDIPLDMRIALHLRIASYQDIGAFKAESAGLRARLQETPEEYLPKEIKEKINVSFQDIEQAIDKQIESLQTDKKEGKASAYERLLEMLMMLMMLFGKNDSQRRMAGAKMGGQAVEMAKSAGDKLVQAAITGAIVAGVGAAVSVGVSAFGANQQFKGFNQNIRNASTSGNLGKLKQANQKRAELVAARDAHGPADTLPATVNGRQGDKSNTLKPEQRAALQKTIDHLDVEITQLNLDSTQLQARASKQIATGQAVMPMGQTLAQISHASGAIAQAQDQKESKILEANARIFESLKGSDEKVAGQQLDLVIKYLGKIAEIMSNKIASEQVIASRNKI